jgi:hypothetical protein
MKIKEIKTAIGVTEACGVSRGMSPAIDFESVDVLADERVVALSERLRSILV